MATTLIFDGKKVLQPGVYTSTKSGIKNPPTDTEYGAVVILDTGSGTGWGGAGINGEVTNGENAIYETADLDTFRSFIRGGIWWENAKGLFRPNKSGTPGVSKLYYVSASTTTRATLTLAFASSSVVVKTVYEGTGANGALTSGVLTKGFGATLSAGVVNTAKFIVKFYVGTYKGTFSDGTDLDGVAAADALPILLAQSPEISTLAELCTWMLTDYDFGQYFKLNASVTGNIVAGDLLTISGYVSATGATTTYNAADVDTALAQLTDVDYNFIITDKSGADLQDTVNVKVLTHITTVAKYEKTAVFAGGTTKAQFSSQSVPGAVFFDNQRVIISHGDRLETTNLSASKVRTHSALNKACYAVGRMCGLTPETPLTFKIIDQDGATHNLTSAEKDEALKKGVLVTYYDQDFKKYAILQGINSLQTNTNVVNNDATSFSISVVRITAQVNKRIAKNAKLDLFGNQQAGPNYNTLAPEDVKIWLVGQLKAMKGSLIKSYEPDIAITKVNIDTFKIEYRYTPNFEINKLLFISFLIEG